MYTSLHLWLHREPATRDLISILSRHDVPKPELHYYEALEGQFAIMLAEGGRTANTLYGLSVLFLPKIAPVGSVWVLRIPMLVLWAAMWKQVYFFGADLRVHLGLPKLIREMQATAPSSLSAHAAELLQKYA